jgi:hypothetical protein
VDEIARQAKEEGLARDQAHQRMDTALADQNRALFTSYLDVLGTNLEPVLADLVLIEHRAQVAGEILEFLRARIP